MKMSRLLLSFADTLQILFRAQDINSESRRRGTAIHAVKRNDRVGLTVYGRFQNHFVTRIGKLRAPLIVNFKWLDNVDNGVYHITDIRMRSACSKDMLGSRTERDS